jgi:mono/diheme cytochrome c family protein
MSAARSSVTRTKHLIGAVLAATLAVSALPLVSVSFAGPSATAPKTVNVTIRDTRFALSLKTAPAGKVRYVVKNVGKSPHNFKIANRTTPTLKTGKSATLTVTFAKAGSYAYLSTVKGDAARGLKGTFKVTAAPASTAGNAKAGKTVFIANCGTCHVLDAAGTRGTIGPNLDTRKHTFASLVTIVTNGRTGTAMPPFKDTLTTEQIQDVAAFVFDATH